MSEAKMIATIAYVAPVPDPAAPRPRYHANDLSRDVIKIDNQPMVIVDARNKANALDIQGFTLVDHHSAVCDWHDAAHVRDIHPQEIIDLLIAQTGADVVVVSSPGLLRFSERSAESGVHNNSRPARFAHVDISSSTAEAFAAHNKPEGSTPQRFAHYNVWRALSVPPQDVPLAVCDARSVAAADLIAADAVFDEPDKPEWSFEGLVVAHNPARQWMYYPNMHAGEALIFKTFDSDPTRATCVPHVAFDNPTCPPDTPPRMSIEMRATAYWFAWPLAHMPSEGA